MKRLLDPTSQKTHYVIAKRQKRNFDKESVFCKLPGESAEHLEHRYALYTKVWAHQLGAIRAILNSANNDLFARLLQCIKDPLTEQLGVVYLALSSNTANNLRVLDDFSEYAAGRGEGMTIRLVRLNSKECFNVKAAVREVVKQVVHGHTRREKMDEIKEEDIDGDGEGEGDGDEEDEENEDNDENDIANGDHGGRISYDFGIVEEWASSLTSESHPVRIVVMLEDTNAFSNEILNQLLQLFSVYATRSPLKVVMGLSSKNVSDWINSNITSKLRTLISGCKLVAKDNKDIGFQVVDDILLQNEITSENPLLLDAQLSLIVLGRFENSNNSIDSLITELKLAYMTHFYQLPLSALVDPHFVPVHSHYDALRKLSSFKTHMEYLLHTFKGMKKESAEWTEALQTMKSLLSSDEELGVLFNNAKLTFQNYQNSVMNAVNLIYFLSGGEKHRFQIYKLVTNNQLINSVYLRDVLKRVQTYDSARIATVVDFINSEVIKTRIGGITDKYIISLQEKLQGANLTINKSIIDYITEYLHSNKNLNMKISDNLFNEVLTINGGISELDELRSSVNLEENYHNLMIHIIRPKLREIIEAGLDEPRMYLRNPLLLESVKGTTSKLTGPLLSRLYHVYKDAPVNINMWDFYVAFKLSLQREGVIKEIKKALELEKFDTEVKKEYQQLVQAAEKDEKEWDKVVYSWFLQSCFELSNMGFLREKSKGDYVEKMIWKNL